MWFPSLCLILTVNYVQGMNIILNKPTTPNGETANDGKYNTKSRSIPARWQVDLQGFYTNLTIDVTSPLDYSSARYLQHSSIQIAMLSHGCPDYVAFDCGGWPLQVLPNITRMYTCKNTKPVRFVKIWRNGSQLYLAEVAATGTRSDPPSRQTKSCPKGIKYKLNKGRLMSPFTSMSVASTVHCLAQCEGQASDPCARGPCYAFSFNQLETPNCLLGLDLTVEEGQNWKTWIIEY